MKLQLKSFWLIAILVLVQAMLLAQAPPLGTAANFVLFTSVGAVTNTGVSQVTGNVGTNSGSTTGFGNVNGQMHDNDGASAQASTDLLIAYNILNATIPTIFPAPLLGNGQIFTPGIYSTAGPSVLSLNLTLDALGDPNAVFIIKINGTFGANAGSSVSLVNGAQACNVFWQIEGAVSIASASIIRGTIIANNSAIDFSSGATLEGRALSTNGAITLNSLFAYIPAGCGKPLLTGPNPPNMGTAACYGLFSSIGPVTNVGVTQVVGDVGTNNGLTTGYNPLLVTGTIHPIPDGSTAQAATDLLVGYNYLNSLPYDIELLFPAQFGNNLVLTPHVYLLNAATMMTGTLFLDAEGDPDAVFVIQINGALSTSTFSVVSLINGTQAQNVYWSVNGAVSINDFSQFVGTIVVNNGAINLNTGVILNGSALTTTGAVSTAAVSVTIPVSCSPVVVTDPQDQTVCAGESVSFTVIATGVNPIYQWRRGLVNLIDGGSITGANTATLTIDPATLADAGNDYNVVVVGDYPPDVTSANASLVVNSAPVIVVESVNVPCSGITNNSITISGLMPNSIGYTIEYSGSTNGSLLNQTASGTGTINIPGLSLGNYNVTLTDANGCTATGMATVTEAFLLTAFLTNVNQPTCNGGIPANNGSATVNVTNGLAPFTYLWSSGQNTATVNNLAPGIYSVTVSDGNNCQAILTDMPVLVTPICCTANVSDIPDADLCEGDITANSNINFPLEPFTALYGPAPTPAANYSLTYVLTTTTGTIIEVSNMGAPFDLASNTPLFTYSLLGDGLYRVYHIIYLTNDGPLTGLLVGSNIANIDLTNLNSDCFDSTYALLTVHPTPTAVANSNSPVCAGQSLVISATGGVNYLWSTTAVIPFNSNLAFNTILNANANHAGFYNVTVTNANGCSAVASTQVVVNNTVASILPSGPTTFCQGNNVTLNASGGGTYLWSTGAITSGILVSTTGIYTVTVSNNGCTATAAQSVTVNSTTASINPLSATTFCQGGSVVLVASGGGTYLWSTGETTAAIIASLAGTYSVTVTNNGCTGTANVLVTINNAFASITPSGATTLCLGSNVTLTASGGGTYLWNTGANTNAILVSTAGTYTVTVTNNGCTATALQAVTVNTTTATITPLSATTFCQGGSVILTASGGGTYLWSTGETTAAILATLAGTYSVTVTNNGCTATANVLVTINNAFASITPSGATTLCQGSNVTLTATGGGTYLWSTGANTAAILVSTTGTYTVSVTNNGCTSTASQAVTVNTTTAAINPLGPTTFCQGGSVVLVASGGGTYLWSTGQTTGAIIASLAGTYTVTVTNNGCSATANATVTLTNAVASISANGATTFCPGLNVTLTASGGGTYLWNTGATTAAILATITGTYTVTVTSNGCTATASQAVLANDTTPPVLGACPANIQSCSNIVTFPSPTFSDNCSGVTLTSSAISGSQFTNGTTTVTFTATDASGNTSTCSFTITVSPLQTSIALSIFNGFGVSCNGANDGSATTSVIGGTSTYTFVWSNGFTETTTGSSTATGLTAGQYSVTVSNAAGACPLVKTFIITQPSAINCTATGVSATCGLANGTATVNATGGIMPYSYNWSNSAITQNLTGLVAGNYTVTVSDINGCVCVSTVTISNIGGGTSSTALTYNQYEGTGASTIPTFYNVNIIEVTGGTQPYDYQWSTSGYVQYNIQVNANGSVTITTIYADNATWIVTVTDSACNSEQVIIDNQPNSTGQILDISSYVIVPDNGTANGSITLLIGGGTPCTGVPAYHYAWSGPTNNLTVFTDSGTQTGLVSGWYIVTVSDCSGQETTGWYWVPKQTRGRGKVADGEMLTAYPNPFTETTTIEFLTNETTQTDLSIYSIDGKQVAQLFKGTTEGSMFYSVTFEAGNLPAGVYFVTLTAENGERANYQIVLTK